MPRALTIQTYLLAILGGDVMLSAAAEERRESPVLAHSHTLIDQPSTSRAVVHSPLETERYQSPVPVPEEREIPNLSDFTSSSDDESDARPKKSPICRR